jgi:hypothetical protein
VTSRVADAVLCLPFYSLMTCDQIEGIGDAFETLHAHAPRVRHALQSV